MGRDHEEAHRALGTREWRQPRHLRTERLLFGVAPLRCAACQAERGGLVLHGLTHEFRSESKRFWRHNWSRFGVASGYNLETARWRSMAAPDPLVEREYMLPKIDARLAQLLAFEARGGGYKLHAKTATDRARAARLDTLWTAAERARLLDALTRLRRTGRSEAQRPQMEAA